TFTAIDIFNFGGYGMAFLEINKDQYSYNVTDLRFYNEYDKNIKAPQLAINQYITHAIMPNNTGLLSQLKTNSIAATNTWEHSTFDVPIISPCGDRRYNNLHVNSTVPEIGTKILLNFGIISIKFQEPVSYSNGNLTVFRRINQENNVIRQIINSRACNFSLSDDQVTIQFEILHCTFNKPGGQYYIQMDNNFVKSAGHNEPIPVSPTEFLNMNKNEF
ncbi:12406_t:CDS:2, partial [Racocetra persica]